MAGGQNPNAWNNWYHAVGSTYGTWLRGDPRGFRTFHHREHVAGDYKNPPPDIYRPVFEFSKKKLLHPPVKLSMVQQNFLCKAMIERLQDLRAEVIAMAIGDNHFHLLARFPALSPEQRTRCGKSILQDGRDPAPRHLLGLARKHASHELKNAGLKPPGPVWADRPKFIPIRNRKHQLATNSYILDHINQRAAVYHIHKGFVLVPEG